MEVSRNQPSRWCYQRTHWRSWTMSSRRTWTPHIALKLPPERQGGAPLARLIIYFRDQLLPHTLLCRVSLNSYTAQKQYSKDVELRTISNSGSAGRTLKRKFLFTRFEWICSKHRGGILTSASTTFVGHFYYFLKIFSIQLRSYIVLVLYLT